MSFKGGLEGTKTVRSSISGKPSEGNRRGMGPLAKGARAAAGCAILGRRGGWTVSGCVWGGRFWAHPMGKSSRQSRIESLRGKVSESSSC